MVHHHRLLGKGGEEQAQNKQMEDYSNCMDRYCGGKKTKPRLYRLLLLSSFVSLTFLIRHRLLFASSSPSLPFLYSFGAEEKRPPPCSSMENNTICCDRTTSFRTDVCFMRGDIRTHSSSSSIFLYTNKKKNKKSMMVMMVVEKIRPYTRKWEKPIMRTIDELSLITSTTTKSKQVCDMHHDVPAVFFSTGGYTGNVYHEFNDGIIPLYITTQSFNKRVVFVLVEYHGWWIAKYGDILSQLSDYPAVDFSGDNRTHCFPEAIVGLRIHDELAIDSAQMRDSQSVLDFRRLLGNAYQPRIRSIELEEARNGVEELPGLTPSMPERPKLVIVSRNGSRGIENEEELVELCEEIGFQVQVLRPDRTTELAKIYRALNNSDAMIGVHGAAMTHLLFLRPGSVFIQIVPLGTDWAAESYYGQPAKQMGLKYIEYRILPTESSLYHKYDKDDPVLCDPNSVTAKGWRVTKEVYLEGQNVSLDLNRFLKPLTRAYQYTMTKRNRMELGWNWSWQQPQARSSF